MKLISVIQNGKRVDLPVEKFQKILEDLEAIKADQADKGSAGQKPVSGG